MRILIIEDEAPAYRRLQRLIESTVEAAIIVDVFDTIQDSVAYFEANPELDLVFMDIQLADGLSFEIFEHVDVDTPVIFTTAYDEYALKAFEVNSIDYLLKPIDEKQLQKALNKFEKLKAPQQSLDLKLLLKHIEPERKVLKERFLVKHRDQLISVKSQDIAYWILEDGMVWMRTLNAQKFAYDKPIDEIESQVEQKRFFRLNRQVIANIDAIDRASVYDKTKVLIHLIPETEKHVIVSREKATEFKKWMDFD